MSDLVADRSRRRVLRSRIVTVGVDEAELVQRILAEVSSALMVDEDISSAFVIACEAAGAIGSTPEQLAARMTAHEKMARLGSEVGVDIPAVDPASDQMMGKEDAQ